MMKSKLINSKYVAKYKTQLALFGIAIIVLLLFIVTSPSVFLKPQIYRAFLSTVPFVGIIALGLTMILALGEIDLSFPAVMAISGFVFAIIFETTGSVIIAIIGCLITGALVGLINGLLITKIGIPSIIATLGMQFFIRGFSNLVSQGRAYSMGLRDTIYQKIFAGSLLGLPVQSYWFIGLAILLWFILFRHKFGEHILFTGDNEKATKMMGINVDKVKIMTFILMAVLASFAGIMDIFRMRTWWPTMGEGYLMMTMATVFVGGTSMFGGDATILGTVIGAFIIGSLEAGIVAAGLSGFWTRFIYGLLIIAAVTLHTVLKKKK